MPNTIMDSLHLQDFPDVAAWPSDNELIAQMDWVRDVCNAALAIRNKLNIRVRQPLEKITIVGDNSKLAAYYKWENESVQNSAVFMQVIKEEINVKSFSFDGNGIKEYATLKLSLNNPVLGKRLPEKMKQIIPASKKGEWKQVDGTVEICGETLLPGEYTLQLEPKPEYKDRAQALSTNDALVILDTNITPELEAEGIARDMVRAIQQARKDAALNVSDRIRLHADAPEPIAAALAAHRDYIMQQTLAVEWLDKKPHSPGFLSESLIDDHKVIIYLAKAA